ncbi:hypothetical protein COV13_01045 [Candidatus Woesearchaeota archaeon CG10_big_fil_rev_8_21_14_0_10_32_9]|nr:MAG: hypothetical protein COV13_01045 [Candidatus Woesearchaeota archaeon CG10_big_fil_rev_8_21_14_0_10_32_9]
MGFLGFGKKKESDNMSVPGLESRGNLQNNFGLDLSEHKDPLMDINSGLKLNDLQEEPPQFDSFGNPKVSRQPLPMFDNAQSNNNGSNNQSSDISKDIQIVLAKLDAIRSELNSLHHEIESLKRQQVPAEPPKKYPW